MFATKLVRLLFSASAMAIVAFASIFSAAAQTIDLPDGAKMDLSAICPVCNMKADTGSLGPAAVVFNDRKVVAFDGAGDFFRYLLDPAKFGFELSNIKSFFVSEYGTKKIVDAKQAYYVTGSDTSGGMGFEAVPFSKKEEAEKFKTEHHGKTVVSYSEVKPEDVKIRKKILKMEHGHGEGDKSKH
ncbi:MAG: nitrous oxide reductase accessory protein NosL [Desulfomonile sp.]|nr:nitrous oxide reductase accessory protein NosL [Deltaproteobacteria bacterium]